MQPFAKAPWGAAAGRVSYHQVRRRVRAIRWRNRKIGRRVSRRGALLVLLYAAVAVPGILTSIHAVTSESPSRMSGAPNVLQFAKNRSAGTLRSLDSPTRRAFNLFQLERPDDNWEYLGPAQGNVRIDPRERIWLELDNFVFDRPSLLDSLRPDDLYRISIAEHSPQLEEGLIKRIARLSGLHELDLRHATPLPHRWEHLTRLPNLRRIWLPESTQQADITISNEWIKIPTPHTGAPESQGLLLIRNPNPDTPAGEHRKGLPSTVPQPK